MTKQKYIIEIKRTAEGFEAIADGSQNLTSIEFQKSSI